MKHSINDIIKALECCSLLGSESCESCPLKEECEDSPLASVMAERALELVKDLLQKNEKLTEERDTFKEAFYNYQNWINSIGAYELEGYERSAAKAVAEIDMWRAVALTKKQLEDENIRLRTDNQELYNKMSERMREEVRIAKKYTARRIRNKLMQGTECMGECTVNNPLAEACSVVREDYITQVIDEVLEECSGEKNT